MSACKGLMGDQVTSEFLQCQIEVGTRPCRSIADLRDDLSRLRRSVAAVARDHNLRLMAASTHPFARGGEQEHTRKERYDVLADELQEVVRRLMICGMHIHVGIDNDDLRIDLMGQVSYVLPHFLALSTSSPFWEGRDTGLMSYRISVWDEMPRTGLPEHFDSYQEYLRHIEILTRVGIIENASMLWWDVRPSCRFPTLEMRIADVCTRLEDALSVASLYLCWLRMLYRLRRSNQRWRRYASFLINENRWRAHRYGIDKGLLDFGRGEVVPYGELLEEILDLVAEDALFFDCVQELDHLRDIVRDGTSAHRQLATYQQAIASGLTPEDACSRVVDRLVAESVEGL